MQIATWNVNSIRARLERLLPWLEAHSPDIVCLQETKVTDDLFPREPIEALGYDIAAHGQKTYNGVAILSRLPIQDPRPGILGFDDPQARVLSATIAGLRIYDLYVVNGKRIPSDKFDYKLAWLDALLADLQHSHSPDQPVVLTGDFNITVDDRDLWDPEELRETILCSTAERDKLQALLDWGLQDALRMHHDDAGIYTWWDYRAAAFRRGMGMRIDHFLVSAPVASRCSDVQVHRQEREGERPSDHAPVVMDLRDA